MILPIKIIAAAAAGVMVATSAVAQSAREARGPSPYVAIENESAPKLVVDAPLADPLTHGVVQIQYRVENVRIVPVFGATIDVVGLPPGQHKVLIDWSTPSTISSPGRGRVATFTVPGSTK